MSKEKTLKKEKVNITRRPSQTFNFDEKIGEGYFSASYFLKAKHIAEQKRPKQWVTMQFFQKKQAILCGVDEAIALLQRFARNPEGLKIWALNDGDVISPFESVLIVEGFYEDFAYLEGIIDGILSRCTSIATNVRETLNAANGKPIIFMGDRNDYFTLQPTDGYAAYIGGATMQATDAMHQYQGGTGVGTMPHSLIQLFNGNLIQACEAYMQVYPNSPLTALVDYNNDVITDSLKVAKHFGEKLYAVRVDTSANMVDRYFLTHQETFGQEDLRGVNVPLIKQLRHQLDQAGFPWVKIVVSGGFNQQKVQHFEQQNAPVDYYGIGASLLKISIDFTGDCVRLNGKAQAKAGRRYRVNPRLSTVHF
ncbi:nicotinate phosphoribosyltransferase [Avibacterium gallinarum]|uniref:nicotinate phosphoribosyltransferase n=1 Tax=Avibacterium gallinarum TaxID=755 RepID=UPI003BF7856B